MTRTERQDEEVLDTGRAHRGPDSTHWREDLHGAARTGADHRQDSGADVRPGHTDGSPHGRARQDDQVR